jgi:FixJ family two-component response regulator
VAVVVHIVDDDVHFRVAVGRLLRSSGYEVAEYESAGQFLSSLPDDDTASCILLDVEMPGLSGPELQKRLAERSSVLPVVFLTGHGDIPMTVNAIKAGAEDFLTKPVSAETLLAAIERALARHQSQLKELNRLKVGRSLVGKLTPREREVFDLVVRGKMNKQIAHELGTTERTIKAHRHRVMEKLDVGSFAELVSMAERLGMLS